MKVSTTQRAWLTAGAALAAGAFLAYRRTRPLGSYAGRVVAITGGSRGLGLEMARLWAAAGAKIAICARTKNDLWRAAHELADAGHEVLAVPCDVTDPEQARAFVDQVVDNFGRIDVLVNNAGIIQAGPVECMTLDDFERAMATHFWAPLHLIQAALPYMRACRGGNIVNIASIGGEISVPHMLPYCASKFALVGLSDGLAVELRQSGIKVTTVCPGLMRTGSPRNAEFKGQHRAEYAWFSISGSLPLLSISSQAAARSIVAAVSRSTPHVRISLPAKATVPVKAALPGLTSRVLALVNGLLPSAHGASVASKRGDESFSKWSPSILTQLTEQAALRNNEVRPASASA